MHIKHLGRLAALVTALALTSTLTSPAPPPTAAAPPATVTTVAAAPVAYAGTVYFTFDDGPHATWTPKMLAVLRKYGAKAVFFEVGQNVSWYPSITRSLRYYGMKIGNHTWSHPNLTLLSTASVTWQLNKMESALGYRPRCVRPPYGATNSRIATIIANRGQRQILWTVDPRDWARPGTWTIVNRVLANVRPGSRILMHDGGGDRSQSVAALDILIPKLRARGYVIGLMAC
ncbi:polysaccharide deacetylase family protein [Humibacillus xanthopallidus]|uniref:Polysaccharide deacetylase n=1 Tax=Humibacillus xanthopallidus TaxID=412689 RepID=A0A543I0C7_9MICO|nr:polysaccharide deacetylase family protein [Humibacillus xanthopallidus]TQM64052.1 polysaccharide deacetylase [Humibacillus xanthopallidus]